MAGDLFLLNQNFSADTSVAAVLKPAASVSLRPVIRGSFLHTGIRPLEAPHSFWQGHGALAAGQEWIFYVLLGLIAVFAIIKYYYSRDLNSLIWILGKTSSRQESDAGGKAGFFVPMFLFLNFFTSIGLLLLAVNQKFHLVQVPKISVFEFFAVSGLGVLGYYLFNEITILLAGFLFGSSKQALQHAKTGSYLIYVLGILLTPILIIYFFTAEVVLLYIAVASVVMAVLFKWILLLRNSYSLNHYTPFHIILYLCGLEIIPIMLLIKLGMMYV